jgi:L,D-transpeptidase ErfK/SrfK
VPASTLIGAPSRHLIGTKETLLDIARAYNLGYNELADLYPDFDPWLPPVGRELVLPTARILPDGIRKGIIINVPELRLYYFTGKDQALQVTTHPVGIGDTDFQTPPGMYSVGNKRANPTWYIPPSLRAKYQTSTIPPGPDNPLGKYWLGLKDTMYGIHGTDIPWAVGRTVTHGCIRMYPEDIERFYPVIQLGTPVQIVYEPVKIAEVGGQIYVEIHRDIYHKFPDMAGSARQKAIATGVWPQVDRQKFMTAVEEQKGIPVNVTGAYNSDRRNSLDSVGTATAAGSSPSSGEFPQYFP